MVKKTDSAMRQRYAFKPGLCPLLSTRTRGRTPRGTLPVGAGDPGSLQCNEASTVTEGSDLLGPWKYGIFERGFPVWLKAACLWKTEACLTLFGGKKKKGKDRALASGLNCSLCRGEAPDRVRGHPCSPLPHPRVLSRGVRPSRGQPWALAPALAPWPRTLLRCSLPQFPPCGVRTSPVAPLSSGCGEPSAR